MVKVNYFNVNTGSKDILAWGTGKKAIVNIFKEHKGIDVTKEDVSELNFKTQVEGIFDEKELYLVRQEFKKLGKVDLNKKKVQAQSIPGKVEDSVKLTKDKNGKVIKA